MASGSYWCHSCSRFVWVSDSISCPDCDGGFLAEYVVWCRSRLPLWGCRLQNPSKPKLGSDEALNIVACEVAQQGGMRGGRGGFRGRRRGGSSGPGGGRGNEKKPVEKSAAELAKDYTIC